MKRTIVLIAALGLVMGALGCQPTTDPVATERPSAGFPRFADLETPQAAQEAREYAVPSFAITDFQETRTSSSWTVTGTIQQKAPAIPGLKFDRVLVVFAYLDGRQCEYQVADHEPLKDLVEPIPFTLALGPDNYRTAGFGFEDFQDFSATSHLDQIVVQVMTNRHKVEYAPNQWTGTFVAEGACQ